MKVAIDIIAHAMNLTIRMAMFGGDRLPSTGADLVTLRSRGRETRPRLRTHRSMNGHRFIVTISHVYDCAHGLIS